jgi:hypothetical protein
VHKRFQGAQPRCADALSAPWSTCVSTNSEDEEGAAAESAIVGDGRDDAKPRQWKSITGKGDFAKLQLAHRAISFCHTSRTASRLEAITNLPRVSWF